MKDTNFIVREVGDSEMDLSISMQQTELESKEREAHIKNIQKIIMGSKYDNIKEPVPFMSQLS